MHLARARISGKKSAVCDGSTHLRRPYGQEEGSPHLQTCIYRFPR